MEIDITDFFMNEDAYDFSASVFEMGDNAGQITWNNAKRESKHYMDWINNDVAKQEVIAHFKDMGFSESDEMDNWPDNEIVALLIQLISGDIREAGLDNDFFDEIDWQAHEQSDNAGRIFYDGSDNKVFYYIGC